MRVAIPWLSFGRGHLSEIVSKFEPKPGHSLPALHAIDATLATSPPRRWRMRWRGGRVDSHTGPDLDLVEHGTASRAFVRQLLLALDVLDDELAVRVVLVDGVELLLPARSFGVVER
jgi:hypothetical protein